VRRAVLRSNYTRRGLLSRTLNLRNALFLHKEKSAGRPTQLGDNYSVPSESGQLFRADPCRNVIFLSVFLPSFVSLSLSLSLSLSSQSSSRYPSLSWLNARKHDLYPVANSFLSTIFRMIFPRELRKSRTGKFSRKKLFRVVLFVRLYAFFIGPFYRPFLFNQNYRLYPRIILAKREITINHINQTTFSWAFQATLTQDSRVSLLAKRGIKQFWGSIIL